MSYYLGTSFECAMASLPYGACFPIGYETKGIVEKAGTIIGLRGKNAVVLAVENTEANVIFAWTTTGIYSVDKNIGLATAGNLSDCSSVFEIASDEAVKYRLKFMRTIPIKDLAERIFIRMKSYILQESGTRPFCIIIILCGWDEENGPQLYKIGPSGISFDSFACASQKAEEQAKPKIEKVNLTEMSTEDLVQHAGKIIYKARHDIAKKDVAYKIGVVGKETDGIYCINPTPWHAKSIEAVKAAKNED